MALAFPYNPTGTLGLQRGLAIAIRKRFRDRMKAIVAFLELNKQCLQESIVQKQALGTTEIAFIMSMLSGVTGDLKPIMSVYLGKVFWGANTSAAKTMGVERISVGKNTFDMLSNRSFGYIEKYTVAKQADLREILTEGISQGDTVGNMAKEIKKTFQTTAWKSEQIARSEVVKTHSAAVRETIRMSGVTKEYKWLTSQKESVCPICRPLHGRVYEVGNPRSPMPVQNTHPNCECGIVPHIRIKGE